MISDENSSSLFGSTGSKDGNDVMERMVIVQPSEVLVTLCLSLYDGSLSQSTM